MLRAYCRRLSLMQDRFANIRSASSLDRQDSEVSPGTILPKPTPSNARANIAPWEEHSPPPDPNIPSINRQPPSAAAMGWSHNDRPDRPTQLPQSIFGGSYLNDSSDNLGQVSPGFTPGNGMTFPGEGEDRRPSIASATTVSSTGSKNSISGRVHKKLQGFFGEDVQGQIQDGRGSSRQNSETSSMQNGQLPPFAPGGGSGRNRNNSMNDAILRSGPPSPSSSRPRTPAPQPSSEVTPWVFQDTEVCVKRKLDVCSTGNHG